MQFHVYFTIRRILWELEIPLPLETIFSQTRNKYNKNAFEKLCQEFNLPNYPDFRWKSGRNHGLGDIFDNEGYNVIMKDMIRQISWP